VSRLGPRSFQVPLTPQFSLPLYRIVNVAIRIGLGKLIEESLKLLLVLFVRFLNRDADPQLLRPAPDRVRHVVEPVEVPVDQNDAVGLGHGVVEPDWQVLGRYSYPVG